MDDQIDPGRLRAWRLFLEAHAAVVTRLGQELAASTGLPLTWYDVLVQLSEAPGERLRMHELARAVLLSRSGLTRLVDRMEAGGLVRRHPDGDDARGTVCHMTPEGRCTLDRNSPIHLAGVQARFTRHIGDEEAEVLSTSLGRVLAASRRE